jgi:hypothetical protein
VQGRQQSRRTRVPRHVHTDRGPVRRNVQRTKHLASRERPTIITNPPRYPNRTIYNGAAPHLRGENTIVGIDPPIIRLDSDHARNPTVPAKQKGDGQGGVRLPLRLDIRFEWTGRGTTRTAFMLFRARS